MPRIDEEAFELLEEQIAFCLENIRAPECALSEAGRFYEEAAQALRAHAILRLLVDADGDGFSKDLTISGHARRAWLKRCGRQKFVDYSLQLSRSGSMLDAMAGDDFDLAAEIFRLSPPTVQKDEYEDGFWYQRLLGLFLLGAPAAEQSDALERLDAAAEGSARVEVCRALRAKDDEAFDRAFEELLLLRDGEVEADKPQAAEDLTLFLDGNIFIEGIAVLKVARRAGIRIEPEARMCPTLALIARKPATPKDEFYPP
jgi:hypothetical protein